jgi:peroxin-5
LNDPTNAEAWYQLGIKQQSNEREDKAIQALRKAVELDPSLLSGWMELSVSHTNEGNRIEAYKAIGEWIERNPRYVEVVTRWKQGKVFSSPPSAAELTECLLAMATSVPGGDLDPDVQIALGVLLNTTDVRRQYIG